MNAVRQEVPRAVGPRVRQRLEPLDLRHQELAGKSHHGPHDHLPVDEVLALLPSLPFWTEISKWEQAYRVQGTKIVLDWLAVHPGSGWQDRWTVSGIAANEHWQDRIAASVSADGLSMATRRARVVLGAGCLMLLRVALPDYEFLCRFISRTLFQRVERSRSPHMFVRLRETAAAERVPAHLLTPAMTVLAKMALHTGKDVDQLTAEDVMEFRAQRPRQGDRTPKGLHIAWKLLAHLGQVPDTTLAVALRRGQRSTAELVDAYNLVCHEVRDVLVRYLDERRTGLDYGSFRSLARQLVGLFWADLEEHHPVGAQVIPRARRSDAHVIPQALT